MKVGGLQPVTLLDYPGQLAATVFASGCNMRCPFCYNPGLVVPELIVRAGHYSSRDISVFLKKRRQYLDAVVISGGEPTLQKDLRSFCARLKKQGYLIKLDTNGLRPPIIRELLKRRLVDYVAMDIKGPMAKREKFCGLAVDEAKIKESIGLIQASGVDYEFRSTLVKGLHSQKDVREMAKLIKGAKKWFLQNFNPGEKLVKKDFSGRAFTRKELEEFKKLGKKYVEKCEIR